MEPVPREKTVHGLRVALVLIGIAITIPAFLTGAELGLSMGLSRAVPVVLAGGAVLCVIGCFVAVIAARTRLTTYAIIEYAFGVMGAKVVNAVIALTVFGWFSVTAAFFGISIQQALRELWDIAFNLDLLIVVGTVLVVATTLFGFRAINRLALVAVPLLFLVLVWLVYLALENTNLAELLQYQETQMPAGRGITAVVGGFIVGAVIMPDFCRHVHNTAHGLLAAVLHFGVAYPLILIMLTLVSVESGQRDFMSMLAALGLGLVGLLVLVFATWTTNTGNLYSNSLVLRTIFPSLSHYWAIIGIGAAGALFAVMGITRYFIDFLVVLGVSIPPVAGIYIADYFVVRRGRYPAAGAPREGAFNWQAFVAWVVATLVGWVAAIDMITITTVPGSDAIVVAFVLYLLMKGTARPDQIGVL
ncbi:cytosine permease [Kineobactrum salinum]|uniref:Cytosine permease n=1 Tax=Kineobactrum salinum TaxID=2708301 RepID=A0A6C0UAT8_9GAMM|nr:cytosine permease [Kineobactrum salinum]QIB67024.1 hypothetical protein G3T16_18125 [Kineobactrum salinum]